MSKTWSTVEITKLTNSQSADEINGTFDWVYEEEFSLRDGFRWSPDGKWIAYWQLDTRGVPEFPLVNNTDSLYPRITNVKYPKVGEKNAACRVGVVSASGGETHWINVPGDPRDNYIAYLEWAREQPRAGAPAIQSAPEYGSRDAGRRPADHDLR